MRRRTRLLSAFVIATAAAVASCAPTGPTELELPDVTGDRLDVAEERLRDAGFEHVWAENTITPGFIVRWHNWAVMAQTIDPGILADPDEEVQLQVGPLDDERTLAALAPDAQVREAVIAALAPPPPPSPVPAQDDDPATPANFGLPAAYSVYRGNDAYGRPYPDRIRRDLAEYVRAVRAVDPTTADTMAPALMATPMAWCSFWLPWHTPQELSQWRAAAGTEARQMGQVLGVAHQSINTDRVLAVMERATTLAAEQFCPAQAKSPDRAVPGSVTGAAIPPVKRISMLETRSTPATSPTPPLGTRATGTWRHSRSRT